MKLLFAIVAVSALVGSQLPNPDATPGVLALDAHNRALTKDFVCGHRWGHDRRHVTPAMKAQVCRLYRLHCVASRLEFDHLIPRELGGADDVANLWPQPLVEARRKDVLENRLHTLVCAGELPLAEAQRAIRTDWTQAYTKYVPQKVAP